MVPTILELILKLECSKNLELNLKVEAVFSKNAASDLSIEAERCYNLMARGSMLRERRIQPEDGCSRFLGFRRWRPPKRWYTRIRPP
jgi:hypothetical protein